MFNIICTPICNMYSNIKLCVLLNQDMSDTFLCNIGVRQGEHLSLLLFSFYVNDLEEQLLERQCNYIDFGDN